MSLVSIDLKFHGHACLTEPASPSTVVEEGAAMALEGGRVTWVVVAKVCVTTMVSVLRLEPVEMVEVKVR